MTNPFDNIDQRLSNIENLLLDIKHKPIETPQPESEQLLTIQQAAEFLKLSVQTIYGYVHRAEIPVSKGKKRLYFSKKELTDWIQAGRKSTVTEIATDAHNYVSIKKKKG